MGFQRGMDSASAKKRAKAAATSMVTSAASTAMSAMDAHSPSRLFMKIGSYIPLGFAAGIREREWAVTESAIAMTQNVISKVAEAVNNGIDTEPTICPVLDLSNVEEGTKRINAMFSRDQALSIDRSMNRSTITSSDQNGGPSTTDGGATFNFTQNNYSPKALSRVEIYRQTNNQFSAFKRAVRV